MTMHELHIQLDLQLENKIDVLKDVASKCSKGYIFVDSSDGHCYLFNKNGNEDDIKKLKKIDDYLFYESNIKSIIIPDSVENIGNFAFYRCENLKSIVIPDSVKSIRDWAFLGCESLTSIVIPDSVENIGNSAFYHCENLKSIVIPDSVKSIRDWAFWGCESLTSIGIPDSVKSIGNSAFYCCNSLKSLTFKGKTFDKVKAIKNYPFGIMDESIIRCI